MVSNFLKKKNRKEIVICTGEKTSIIDFLRNIINSTLPNEVFYSGENDLSIEHRQILINDYDEVYVNDISTYFNNEIVNIEGWAIKSFAILASRFEEVILMDADVIYLRDPAELFGEKGYKRLGSLFFQRSNTLSGAQFRIKL
eukprot:jgi/Orpsp1_1/1191244/evm.model.d7180000084351.1